MGDAVFPQMGMETSRRGGAAGFPMGFVGLFGEGLVWVSSIPRRAGGATPGARGCQETTLLLLH